MMLSLPAAVRIRIATTPTDLRKSFDTLAEVVRQQFRLDPLSGQLFVFRNRRGDRVKLLYWDEDGYVLLYKIQESDCPHSCPFTDFAGLAHNLTVRPSSVVAVDAGIPIRDSRSRPMSQADSVVPPRARRSR